MAEETKSDNSAKRLATIVVGLLLVVLGCVGVTTNETVNKALITQGVTMSVEEAIAGGSVSSEALLKIADDLDAVSKASVGDIDALNALVLECEKSWELDSTLSSIVPTLVPILNAQLDGIDNIDVFRDRLDTLIAAIRAAATQQ